MGLLSLVHRTTARTDTSTKVVDPLDERFWAPSGWVEAFRETGIRMTAERAMTLSAVWCGVNFLARNLGSFPLITYQRLDARSRDRATKNPLYRLLRWQPNRWQTAQEYWEMAVAHVLLRGNAFSRILSGSDGVARELVPIHPDRVEVEGLPNGSTRYTVWQSNGTRDRLTQDQVFHIRGLSSDGRRGMSVVQLAARSLGAAVATDSFAARFFNQGATPSLVVQHPGVLGDEARHNVRESMKGYVTGLKNSHGILVLEEGMTAEKLGVNPEDAQLLMSREHTVREVARWLGLPRQVLSDPTADTYASIEAFGLQLIIYSFRPLATRVEQAIQRDLVFPSFGEDVFSEFLMDALARGDMKARGDFYRMAIMAGWMTRNEARAKDNMNPGPPALDEYLEPLNMIRAGDGRRASDQRMTSQFGVRATLLALEASHRIVRREQGKIEAAAKRFANDGKAWEIWIDEFYSEHVGFVASALRISRSAAQGHASRQAAALKAHGLSVADEWEATVVPALASVALEDHDVDDEHGPGTQQISGAAVSAQDDGGAVG